MRTSARDVYAPITHSISVTKGDASANTPSRSRMHATVRPVTIAGRNSFDHAVGGTKPGWHHAITVPKQTRKVDTSSTAKPSTTPDALSG